MAGLSADWVGVLGWGLAGCGLGLGGAVLGAWWGAGGLGLAGSGVLARFCLGLGPSGRFGLVGWLVVRAVRWSVVVGPLWFMFAHFR